MCGLFGVMSENNLSDAMKRSLRELGIVSSLRGIHSTGLISVKVVKKKRLKISWRKEVTNPTNFFENPNTCSMIASSNTKALIGHCRWATIGKINYENAHPFNVGSIVGVHNGTIDKFAEEAKKRDCADSLILYEKINNVGVKQALRDAIGGAYAIVYVDDSTRKIVMARNGKRTLYTVKNQENTVMMWASEKEMLQLICARSPYIWQSIQDVPLSKIISYDVGDIKNPDISDVWDYNKTSVPVVQNKVAPVTKKEEETKEVRRTSIHKGLTDLFDDNEVIKTLIEDKMQEEEDAAMASAMFPLGKTEPDWDEEDKNAKDLFFWKDYNGNFISKEKALHLLEKGCVVCGESSGPGETTYFFSKDQYICEYCSNHTSDGAATLTNRQIVECRALN